MYRAYLLVKWWIHHAFEIKRLNVVIEFVEQTYSGNNETDKTARDKKVGEAMIAIENNEASIEACKKLLFG